MKFRKEIIFGIIALSTIGLFIVGINYLKGTKILGSPYRLYAEYEDVTGLIKGNPILISGYTVGKVGKMELDMARKIAKVTLEFDEEIDIPINATAKIYSSDFLGSKAIRVAVEDSLTAATEFLQDGDFIVGTLEESFLEEAEKLVPEGTRIMIELSRLGGELNQLAKSMRQIIEAPSNRNAISGTLEDIQGSASNLNSNTARLDTITSEFLAIARETKSIVENLADQNKNIETIIGNVAITTDSLRAASGEIKQLMTDASSAMGSVEGLVSKLDTTSGTLGLLLNDRALYDSLVNTSDNINALLREVNEKPQRFFDDIKIYLIERKPPKEKRSKNSGN